MMPPEQETNTNINAPNISPITNRTESSSIHGEAEGSFSNKVKPSLDDHNAIPSRTTTVPLTSFSILPQSLRPVTLKVSTRQNSKLF